MTVAAQGCAARRVSQWSASPYHKLTIAQRSLRVTHIRIIAQSISRVTQISKPQFRTPIEVLGPAPQPLPPGAAAGGEPLLLAALGEELSGLPPEAVAAVLEACKKVFMVDSVCVCLGGVTAGGAACVGSIAHPHPCPFAACVFNARAWHALL